MFEIIRTLDAFSATLKQASRLGAGARFFRCALQVNPYVYTERYAKGGSDPAFASQEAYDAAMVEAARAADIQVVAITDHFRVEGSESLRTAFEAAGITVFPGFEACSSEGVHLLCLYPPGTSLSRVIEYIGQCSLRDRDAPSPQSQLGCEEIMRLTAGNGGLVIAAHVTNSNGLLEHMKGGSRKGPWRSKHLLAAAIPGAVDDVLQPHKAILINGDPEYYRMPPVALINASDVTSPDGFEEPRSWCWIKMAEPTIGGLRQACLAADSRIWLSSAALADDSAEIAAVAWDGGFLDEQVVRLNNGLNVLIGGRGAGKSLLIESIRHAFACPALGAVAGESHAALIRKVLGPSTRVSVAVREAPPSSRWYVVERTGVEPPVVRGPDGAVIPGLDPIDLIDGLEIYGQHELSELTRDKELLASILNRYVQDRAEAEAQRAALARDLEASREEITSLTKQIERLRGETSALPKLRNQIEKMNELGAKALLDDKLSFERAYEAVQSKRAILEGFRNQAAGLERDVRAMSEDHVGSEGTDTMVLAAREAGDHIAAAVAALARHMESIDNLISGLDKQRPGRAERQRPIEQELERLGVKASAYEEIARSIAALETKQGELEGKLTGLEGQREARAALLDRWGIHHTAHLHAAQRAAKKAGRALEGRVRVAVRRSEDLSAVFDTLSAHVTGAGPKSAVDRLREIDGLSLPAFADAIRDGAVALADRFRLTDAAARNVAAAGEPLAMKVEEIALGPAAEVELNVGSPGANRWKRIDDLSAGQKATAVLLLLLGGSSSPLIIDQPEDDLDNRFIADTIVETMRREKRHRQFIFSSHNANIPVLGDAEQIVTLRPGVEDGRECSTISIEETGSLDQPAVRRAVEMHLEGGQLAFELRRAKYGY